MVDAPLFQKLQEMEASAWLAKTKATMLEGQWPSECVRCQETEPNNIRAFADVLDQQTLQRDYLQVGGVLDNVCNAASLSCNENLSTRIGSLKGKIFPVVNNFDRFQDLPADRIVHLDINGGEPSYSKNYRAVLTNLPPNLRTLRLNTNCSTVLTELTEIVRVADNIRVNQKLIVILKFTIPCNLLWSAKNICP
jgi:hypothetical protein